MRKALNSLPSTPSKAYEQVLTRIRAAKHSSETAFRTLTWIFHAKRAVRMDELREALVVQDKKQPVELDETDMQELLAADILEICQSLVVYEEASGVVRFSHFTVQEFLESQVRESKLCLPEIELAKTCLAYLPLKVFDEDYPWDDDSWRYQLNHYMIKY
jgi:hypothetical protein